jgi:hypothetical protein
MTKVQLEFGLTRPLNELLLDRISHAHSYYGLHRLTVAPSADRLVVEYDASRLTPDQVQAALHRSGIPATRLQA